MNKNKHMPMLFTELEKSAVRNYLRRFHHSQFSIKLLLCAYYADRYHTGYISVFQFIDKSIGLSNHSDNALRDYWGIRREWRQKFFGVDSDVILNGTLNDVEALIVNNFTIKYLK